MEKPRFDYSKLNGRITEKYGTRRNFCKAIGIRETTLSNKLNHKASVLTGDILTWSAALGIEVDEIGAYFFTQKVLESRT